MTDTTAGDGLVIGIDVGTGGCKVTVIDSRARLLREARVSYESSHPRTGWVEQDPAHWLAAVEAAMDDAMAKMTPAERAHVKAISFSAPTHVAVLTDDRGRVIRPAIMWNDQRSGAQAERLTAGDGESVRAIAGNAATPTWTLPQLLWLRENEPEAIARVARLRFMKDWVRSKLTASDDHVTDRVDAQGALLYDLSEGGWSEVLAEMAGIDVTALPHVVEPDHVSGLLAEDHARRWGLGTDLAMVVGTTDTAAELLAAGVVADGHGAVKLASAGNVALVSRARPSDERILCYEHVVHGLNYGNAATSAAAASLRWFSEEFLGGREGIESDSGYARVDDAVRLVPPGSDGLIFIPFLNGERAPRFDPQLRAGFLGFTARHSWKEAARAVMEGVAFSIKDAAALHPVVPRRLSLVGGGARSAVWPQIVADVLDRELVVSAVTDSSTGAALVAGVAIGVFPSYEAAADAVSAAAQVVVPDRARVAFYAKRFETYRTFADATAALSHALAEEP